MLEASGAISTGKDSEVAKLGEPVPTMHVILKETKQTIKINVEDFKPKLHAKIEDSVAGDGDGDDQPAVAAPKAKAKGSKPK